MKKKQFYLGIAMLFLTITTVFTACNNDEDDIRFNGTNVVETELQGFFGSDAFKEVSTSLDIQVKHLMLDKRTVNHYKKGVTQYCIPVQKDGVVIGLLHAFSKNNGSLYRVLYEDRKGFSENYGGTIRIVTSKNKYVATLACTPTNTKKMSMKIVDVATVRPRIRKRSESWPSPDDGWWDCTTRCYKMAKDACGSDSQCNFLCDLADLAAGCTVTVAAACAIYCA